MGLSTGSVVVYVQDYNIVLNVFELQLRPDIHFWTDTNREKYVP